MIKLSKKEIRQRFQELANFKNLLHPRLKERNNKLQDKVKKLEDENKKLKEENKQVQKISLELEEVKEMLYWRKQCFRKKDKIPIPAKDSSKWEKPKEKTKRSAESYRRSLPKKEDVTWEVRYDLDECPDCGCTDISDKKEHINYREDLDWLSLALKQIKKITKRIIESWKCNSCNKRKSVVEIPKQEVTIWRFIKATVVYLTILLWLSHREVIQCLKAQYNIDISEWQIVNSLEEEANLLRPYYQNIYNSLQLEIWCNYDETTWKILWKKITWEVKKNWSKSKKKNDWWDWEWNYAWVKAWVESDNVIFWFWRSRWKGVAEKLRWDPKIKKWDSEEVIKIKNQIGDQVWISDDYWSYRNTFVHHQLCWAHPFRKIRDLAQSWILDQPISKHCIKLYENFSKLYKKVQKSRDKFNEWDWNWDYWWYKSNEDKEKDIKNLKLEFDKFCTPHDKDPWKLKTIKESLKERKDRYFICLYIKWIPLDNNKAERLLRKVVLKRKKSFWCRSQKWANTLSILYSVVFSIYNSNPPENFFEEYEKAINLEG